MSKKNGHLKLDLACGNSKKEGFLGVDIAKLPTVDKVCNLKKFPWPWKKESVEEIFSSHFFEHLKGQERIKFMEEAHRILKPGSKMTIVVPYYASMRAIQDPTHEWPPVCEASFLYFNRAWMAQNKLEHYGIKCNFDFSYCYNMAPEWASRHIEAQGAAIKNYINIVSDIQVVLTKQPL